MMTLQCRDRTFMFDRPVIMGILNVARDSFSGDGFCGLSEDSMLHAKKMIAEGADIIDIGGESTRPGAKPVSFNEEFWRVVPFVEALVSEVNVPISVDTMKPGIAEACLRCGAHIINDVSGLRDERMMRVVARHNAPVVIMHMQGTPETMQIDPHYQNVVAEVAAYLRAHAYAAETYGIKQIIVDPGIGFGKTSAHNIEILQQLQRLKLLAGGKYPLLVGPSRKGFIGAITGRNVHERLAGTLAAVTACVLNGADMVRVHDIKEAKDAVMIAHAIRNK